MPDPLTGKALVRKRASTCICLASRGMEGGGPVQRPFAPSPEIPIIFIVFECIREDHDGNARRLSLSLSGTDLYTLERNLLLLTLCVMHTRYRTVGPGQYPTTEKNNNIPFCFLTVTTFL